MPPAVVLRLWEAGAPVVVARLSAGGRPLALQGRVAVPSR